MSTVQGHNLSHKTAKKDTVMNALFGQRQHHTVLRKWHTYHLLCPPLWCIPEWSLLDKTGCTGQRAEERCQRHMCGLTGERYCIPTPLLILHSSLVSTVQSPDWGTPGWDVELLPPFPHPLGLRLQSSQRPKTHSRHLKECYSINQNQYLHVDRHKTTQ